MTKLTMTFYLPMHDELHVLSIVIHIKQDSFELKTTIFSIYVFKRSPEIYPVH